MVEKGRFLVVVSVLEGRKFPKRSKHKLIAEARFDGELLATDPIDHNENPDFTQELAWELDKKGLHQHRLQRTSIKVQVYAVDSHSTMKEPIGYVVLDLRSASSQQTSKFYQLLHTKYQKNKPELKLSIYIDDDKGAQDSGFKAKEAPARVGQDPPPRSEGSDYDPKGLIPILDKTEGYYQIGPKQYNEHFVLSVTVAFAANLPQLIPTNIPLPDTGFFFYYSLLSNDVTNEVFTDLLNPNFAAERASVRLRSSVDTLRHFFTSQPGITVHLCCGDQSLGCAEVSLAPLIKKDSTEIYLKPVSIEGAFQLIPPNRLKQQLPPVPDALKPIVGVSVALRREDMALVGTPIKNPTAAPITVPTEQTASPSPQQSPQQTRDKSPSSPKQKPAAGQKMEKKKMEVKKRGTTPPPSPPAPHEGSYTETFESNSNSEEHSDRLDQKARDGHTAKQGKKEPPEPAMEVGLPPPPQYQVITAPHMPEEASSSTQHHIAIPPQAHHFSFSIDLRSISNIEVQHHANVFLRYTYQFFGSSAPIITHPPVEVRKGMEVLMPQSYCAFDFAATPQQLQDTFSRIPLVVELWDRVKDKAQNVLLGGAQIFLSTALSSERVRAAHPSGTTGWRQVWSDKVNVFATEMNSRHIGDLHVILSLEDWGPITQKVIAGGESSQATDVSNGAPKPLESPPQQPKEPRETQEYKAAMELEMWKEQQESLFEAQLREKEAQYMKALAEEWKRRDKERELIVKKKVAEYHQLEGQLKKTLNDLEKREKQLAANEQEVLRLRADLQRDHDRKMSEMREASRRVNEDCEHQVQLEKNKVKELDEYIVRLKQQITDAESKKQQVEKEFGGYREQQNSKPEVRLQSEINLLTLEKAELERKLDGITKTKIHYKQQWGKALKEVARLKQKEQAAAKAQLRKQQQELEHMRLRYLAAEEKELVKSERKELEGIKNELNQLKEQDLSQGSHKSDGMHPLMTDGEDVEDEHITRLIEERDTLLRTGVYTNEDRIITELDRQIRDAIYISKKGSEKLKKEVYQEMRNS